MIATAMLFAVIFFIIYLVVSRTVYNHQDEDLKSEAREIISSISIFGDQFIFANEAEWTENEHSEIEVNPTFIQVSDPDGIVLRTSRNLNNIALEIKPARDEILIFNTRLSERIIRQIQMPLKDETGQISAFVSVAIPFEGSEMVLRNLFFVLLVAYPLVLLVLFFGIRAMAQKSIRPVEFLTGAAERITRESLNERITLPVKKDELYSLTVSFNNLLDRIEQTILREKQFSSDASHELRTPLAVLKGNLELMSRRPRDKEYYLEKTNICIAEVDKMSQLVEQLLLLARYENPVQELNIVPLRIGDIVNKVISRHVEAIEEKRISLFLDLDENTTVQSEAFMLEQVIENIFSNAIKYSYPDSSIGIILSGTGNQYSLAIKDDGIGMNSEDIARIFNRFYRTGASRNEQVKGYGLGLAISKRFADILGIAIRVESVPAKGTTFTLVFPPHEQ